VTDQTPVLVLLDGHGIIHRSFHAFKEPLTVRRTGEVVTAVYGFVNTLFLVIEQLQPTHMAVALDAPGKTFRHEMDVAYKAHRVATPDDLVRQMQRVREVIDAFNIPVFMVEGYEADDLLGTLAVQADALGIDTYLVTLDSDIVQLIRRHVRVFMFRPYVKQQPAVIYDAESARQHYGVRPEQMPDFKALKGDPSDNIPGVPGIGEVTARRLLEQFPTVEAIYEHLDELPEKLREKLAPHRELALKSKEMATIHTDAPVKLDLGPRRWRRSPQPGSATARSSPPMPFARSSRTHGGAEPSRLRAREPTRIRTGRGCAEWRWRWTRAMPCMSRWRISKDWATRSRCRSSRPSTFCGRCWKTSPSRRSRTTGSTTWWRWPGRASSCGGSPSTR
jgi:5'-3' exonuclease